MASNMIWSPRKWVGHKRGPEELNECESIEGEYEDDAKKKGEKGKEEDEVAEAMVHVEADCTDMGEVRSAATEPKIALCKRNKLITKGRSNLSGGARSEVFTVGEEVVYTAAASNTHTHTDREEEKAPFPVGRSEGGGPMTLRRAQNIQGTWKREKKRAH